jgi:hypothetical protein
VLSFALHNKKYQVIDFLIEMDLIDIRSCMKRSPTSLNNTNNLEIYNGPTPSVMATPNLDKNSCSEWSIAIESMRLNKSSFTLKVPTPHQNGQASQTDFSKTAFTDSRGFNNTIHTQVEGRVNHKFFKGIATKADTR